MSLFLANNIKNVSVDVDEVRQKRSHVPVREGVWRHKRRVVVEPTAPPAVGRSL
jgi:hypothetical protein